MERHHGKAMIEQSTDAALANAVHERMIDLRKRVETAGRSANSVHERMIDLRTRAEKAEANLKSLQDAYDRLVAEHEATIDR
jgi:uncharacterized coiled-coil DUF342 family protein